jgi:hypothetical protein
MIASGDYKVLDKRKVFSPFNLSGLNILNLEHDQSLYYNYDHASPPVGQLVLGVFDGDLYCMGVVERSILEIIKKGKAEIGASIITANNGIVMIHSLSVVSSCNRFLLD